MAVLARQQPNIVGGVLVPTTGPLIGQEYIRVRDQTGQIWIWWIDYSLAPNWAATPEHPHDQEVRFYLVPYWLKLVDDESQVWHVYPEVDGSPLVEVAQPSVGEGIANSPSLRVKGGVAKYKYNIVGGGLDVVAT